MQYVDDDGISVREFQLRAGARKDDTRMLLARLSKWWRYVRVEMAPGSVAHGPNSIVRPTSPGREARRIWRELFATIEMRWCERFGTEAIARLRAALENFVDAIGSDHPEYLPILGYGLASGGREGEPRRSAPPPPARGERSRLPLSAMLSKVLLTFAIAFEEESDVSLAICANVLRVGDDDVVLVRELPRRSGVSKEAIDMATGYLVRHGYAKLETRSAPNRAKALVLTSKGRRARAEYRDLMITLEERWVARFGAELVRELLASLEAVTGSDGTPLLVGLEPPPGGWRAALPRDTTLLHFPTVLHRGGFPDVANARHPRTRNRVRRVAVPRGVAESNGTQRSVVGKTESGWVDVEREGYVPGVKTAVVRHTLIGGRKDDPCEPGPSSEVRYFDVPAGSVTRLEKHEHEHFVIVGHGTGHVIVGNTVTPLAQHDVVYVAPWEPHQFVNRGTDSFGFFCIVPAARDFSQELSPEELDALMRSPAGAYADPHGAPPPRKREPAATV